MSGLSVSRADIPENTVEPANGHYYVCMYVCWGVTGLQAVVEVRVESVRMSRLMKNTCSKTILDAAHKDIKRVLLACNNERKTGYILQVSTMS